MRTLKAVKIDPYESTVTEIEVTVKDKGLRWAYDIIGHGCDCVDLVYPYPKHCLIVDDEGLLKQPTPPLFIINWYHQPLAGIGLFMGLIGREGDLGSNRVPLQLLQHVVAFPGKRLKFEGFEQTEGMTNVPGFDEPFFTIGTHPLWSVDSEEEKEKKKK